MQQDQITSVSPNSTNAVLNAGAIGKPFKIVCVRAYEFEGRQFVVGEIGYNGWGRNIPDGWRKATDKDIEDYINRRC